MKAVVFIAVLFAVAAVATETSVRNFCFILRQTPLDTVYHDSKYCLG